MGLRGSLYRKISAERERRAKEKAAYKEEYEKVYKQERSKVVIAKARTAAKQKAKGGSFFAGFAELIATPAPTRKRRVRKKKTKRKGKRKKRSTKPRKVVYY